VTGGGWGQDPFGGSPFGGEPFGGGSATGGPAAGRPTPTPAPVFGSAPPPHQPGGEQTNTLATLSVIFAFAFAPAGAVLGHLGLREIARTGEKGRQRAIVGIALSYSIIVIVVIGLVVWTVTRDEAKSSTASSSSRPTTTCSTPATSGPLSAPPTLNPGRTVDAGELPALVLGGDEVDAIATKNGQPAPSLTAAPPSSALEPSPGAQGSTDPADFAPAIIAGSETGYRDSGYRAVYTQAMTGQAPAGTQTLTQSVLAFPEAATAQRALQGFLQLIARCLPPDPSGYLVGFFKFTEHDGASLEDWELTAPQLAHTAGQGDPYYRFDGIRYGPPSAGPPYSNERAIGVKGNVIVDVAFRGVTNYLTTLGVLAAILKKLS
jgi:eukaryotic-like serine/threonine-protein kinase